tara:strand:+ start:98 stop:253 length:156 start_codon:yes stop_codon:yes gene_type:complete
MKRKISQKKSSKCVSPKKKQRQTQKDKHKKCSEKERHILNGVVIVIIIARL